MTSNFLKLNDDKTEFMILGSQQLCQKISVSHLEIGNAMIDITKKVRNLGTIFDSNMTLCDHISRICKSASFHLRNIGLIRIRKYLNNQATEQLVHAFVTSHLDMGNSLLFGLPNCQIKRLTRYCCKDSSSYKTTRTY